MKNNILQILGIIRIETRVLPICSPFRLCPGERDLSIKSTPHGEDNKFSLTRRMMSIIPAKCCKYFLRWCHAKYTIETDCIVAKGALTIIRFFLMRINSCMQTQYFLTTDWYLLFLLYAQIIRNTGSRAEENVQTLHISELLSVVLKLIKYVWVCFFVWVPKSGQLGWNFDQRCVTPSVRETTMLLIVLTVSLISLLYPTNREFKNLRRLLQGKRHFAFIKSLVIEPCLVRATISLENSSLEILSGSLRNCC